MGGGSRLAYSAYNQVLLLLHRPICLYYYVVIQDFMHKALFSKYRQLEVGEVTGRDTVLNHCKSALDLRNFT